MSSTLKQFKRSYLAKIELNPRAVSWHVICKRYYLDCEFLDRYLTYIYWDIFCISHRHLLTPELVLRYRPYIEWSHIKTNLKFNPSILDAYVEDLKWNRVLEYLGTEGTEELLRQYRDRVNWYVVAKTLAMTEAFMAEMEDYLDLNVIRSVFSSKKPSLSEDFLHRFCHRLNFESIIMTQRLSEEFMLAHLSYLPLRRISLQYPEFYAKYQLEAYELLTDKEPLKLPPY